MSHSITSPHRSLPGAALALALLLVTPLLTLPVAAQPPAGGPELGPPEAFGAGGPPEGPGRFPLLRIARYLELTDTQIDEAKALLDELKADAEPIHEEAAALRTELQGLLEGDSPDPEAVGTRVIRLHELADEGRALRDTFETSFEALLTADQLDRWELVKGLRGLLGGPGHGGPGGPR